MSGPKVTCALIGFRGAFLGAHPSVPTPRLSLPSHSMDPDTQQSTRSGVGVGSYYILLRKSSWFHSKASPTPESWPVRLGEPPSSAFTSLYLGKKLKLSELVFSLWNDDIDNIHSWTFHSGINWNKVFHLYVKLGTILKDFRFSLISVCSPVGHLTRR